MEDSSTMLPPSQRNGRATWAPMKVPRRLTPSTLSQFSIG